MSILKDYIEFAIKAGRPKRLDSPYFFQLVDACINSGTDPDHLKILKAVKAQLFSDKSVVNHLDLGAGSRKLRPNELTVSKIARNSLKNVKQAVFLAKLAKFVKARTIVELGTSFGTSSLVIALQNAGSQIYTIEGSPEIAARAAGIFCQNKVNNIKMIEGNFDEVLPDLLKKIGSFDLMFIDGNHSYEATKKYFDLALTHASQGSVVVFDDIRWSDGMKKAWDEIISSDHVKTSIDFFTFGLVIINEDTKKQDFWVNCPSLILG